ncbi:MAG: hypothetical protein AAFV53_33385, partial [Myxococcota bacterium]
MKRTITLGVLLGATLSACDVDEGPLTDAAVRSAVKSAFAEKNVPGQTGMLLAGQSGTFKTDMFDTACLERSGLATVEESAEGVRISPTYVGQQAIVAKTDSGYCVDIGKDPVVSIGEVRLVDGVYEADAAMGVKSSTAWSRCIDTSKRRQTVIVSVNDAREPVVETDAVMFQGDCPHPIPASASRPGGTSPEFEASAPPSRTEVLRLAQAFDNAIASHDPGTALEMVACYNFLEDAPFGACATSEIIGFGSGQKQEANPWLGYGATSFNVFGRPRSDANIPGLYHVPFVDRRSGGQRSVSVQKIDGQWKFVGVIYEEAAGLTSAQIVNNLHERTNQETFRVRIQGEDPQPEPEPVEEPIEVTTAEAAPVEAAPVDVTTPVEEPPVEEAPTEPAPVEEEPTGDEAHAETEAAPAEH